MTHWLAAFGLSAALILAAPLVAPLVAPGAMSVAAEETSESEDPSELALEGIERLMQALEALIQSIPQYEMPEINENGDIIIRRKRHGEPAPDEGDDGDIDQTQT